MAATALVYYGAALLVFCLFGAAFERWHDRRRPAEPAAPLNNGTPPAPPSPGPRSRGGGAARRAGRLELIYDHERELELEHDGPADNWGGW